MPTASADVSGGTTKAIRSPTGDTAMRHPSKTKDKSDTQLLPAHLRLGAQGEDVALDMLSNAGFILLDRNWRYGRLELDLVFRDGDTTVFVEVKTRKHMTLGEPAQALTRAKRRTLCRAASAWLAAHNAWDSPCRFDVVCIKRMGNDFYPEHYRHAFSYEPPMDSCHAPWQPW